MNIELLVGAVSLSHWGVIRAQGPDAQTFLQGQLSNDVLTLSASQLRLAGFCSAKGRLQASFLIWKPAPDEVLLACASSVLAATLKRLSMFVLRAKCKLTDATHDVPLWGVAGSAAASLIGDAAPWAHCDTAQGTLLRLPDVDGVPRGMLVPSTPDALPRGLSLEAWRCLEVRSGIPFIEAATVDQFVPQMLNFEVVGGVDFRKGCYPGQEVVARSQYRGTIKRRMFLFETAVEAQAGQEVFHSADPAQPAGMVVNAASDGVGTTLLAEVKLAALDHGALHLGSADGGLMHRLALPYALPCDLAEA